MLLGAQKPIRIVCVREVQRSIKDSVHRLLSDQIELLGLGSFYEILQAEIRGKNGTEILFSGLSTQTSESIKSLEGADICWVEEAQAVSDKSWRVLIPTIRKEGSEIWVSFNPGTRYDAVWQRFVENPPKDAQVVEVSYKDNPWLPSVLKDEIEHLKATDYEDYLHVWEGQFKQMADHAIYAKQLLQAKQDGRICDVPIASGVLVDTFWDLGRNDHTAIWFMQSVGPQYRFIDYYEARLEDIDHYVRVIRQRDYLYGRHYLPHDVTAKILGMPKTRQQQLEDMGIRPIEVVPRTNDLNEGIERVRALFSQCWFDKTRCERGIDVLSNYVWRYDEDRDTHHKTPLHNWASNGADAFRMFAQGYSSPAPKLNPKQAAFI